MKTPGGAKPPGEDPSLVGSLEHAEDDGADEGESNIRGNNAQSADDWTYGHWGRSLDSRLPAKNARS